MRIIDGGVTAPKGFEAAGTAAQIKYKDRMDMALIYSKAPCVTAGTFTANLVKAAPVKWDQAVLKSGHAVRAIIVNSGIANACTGKEGYAYCEKTAEAASLELGIPKESVLLGSTGVIGMQLPVGRICEGIRDLAAKKQPSAAAGSDAARAIMTTDTRKKEIAVEFAIGDKTVTVGGMAKGSGMIHPNMCTMLSFITTDALIDKRALQKAMSEDVEETYNMISVDGDTSTNDTALILANGMAENPEIAEGSESYLAFKQALHAVNEYLAKQMAGDGEGATALFTAHVMGADTKECAKVLARSIVSSNLTKAAIAGHDANWGRIICAMGYSGTPFDPEKTDLFIESGKGRLQLVKNGAGTGYDENEAAKILSMPEVTVIANLNSGTKEATAWGCDLTHGYIDINADYRS